MIPRLKKLSFDNLLKWLTVLFVILIPIADHTRFSLQAVLEKSYVPGFLSRILPVRIVFLILAGTGIYYLLIYVYEHGFKKLLEALNVLFKDHFFLALLGLWVVRALSIIFSAQGVQLELFYFFTSMLVLYVILKFLSLRFRLLPFQLLKVYVAVGSIVALYGLVQLFSYLALGKILPGVLVGGNFIRLPATFFDANHFPAYLATVAPMLISYAWITKNRFLKVGFWAAFYLIALIVLFSFSRSGLVAVAIGGYVMIYFALRLRIFHKLMPILLGIALAGIVIYISAHTPKSFVERITSIANPLEKSTTAHILLLQGGFELFKANPILGVGYGSFSENFRSSHAGGEHALVDPATDVRVPAHSLWFEALAETGTLGITTYLILMGLLLVKLIQSLHKVDNYEYKVLITGLFASCTGLLTGAVFYSYNLEFFWFFLFNALSIATVGPILFKEGVIKKRPLIPEYFNIKQALPALAVFSLGIFLILYDLGGNKLLDYDEGVYAVVAKELSKTRDYFGLTMGGTNWFDKPPLYIWLTAPMVQLFLPVAYAARIWAALFGIGVMLLTYFLTAKMFNRTAAFFATLILITSTHFVYYSRNGILDVPVTFFMVLCVYLYYVAKKSPFFYYFFGVSLALGVLTKGPVAFLVLPPILVDIYLRNRRFSFNNRYFWGGLGLFFLFAGSWHLYEIFRFGDLFIKEYFGYKLFSRAIDANFEGHSAKRLVYLDVIINSLRIWSPLFVVRVVKDVLFLPGIALIWSLLLILYFYQRQSLLKVLNRIGTERLIQAWFKGLDRQFAERILFLLIWSFTILVTFTLMESKLIWYVVSIYPPLAILGGAFMANTIEVVRNLVPRRLPNLANQLYIYIGSSALIISGVYFATQVDKYYPPDYNADSYHLISTKNSDDMGKASPTYFFNVGPNVARYYSEGEIKVFSADNNAAMEFVLKDNNQKTVYVIGPLSIAQQVYKSEQDYRSYNSRVVAISGDLVLIRKRWP